MPRYEYLCPECLRNWESFHPISERGNEYCCGVQAKRLIVTSSKPVIYEYFSENLNAHITGPAQRRKIMKERGVEEVG